MTNHCSFWWACCSACVRECENVVWCYFDVWKIDVWELISLLCQSVEVENSDSCFVKLVHSFTLHSVVKDHVFYMSEIFQSCKHFQGICRHEQGRQLCLVEAIREVFNTQSVVQGDRCYSEQGASQICQEPLHSVLSINTDKPHSLSLLGEFKF